MPCLSVGDKNPYTNQSFQSLPLTSDTPYKLKGPPPKRRLVLHLHFIESVKKSSDITQALKSDKNSCNEILKTTS